MKKRIFAASMASVMALSSVSVVAFADETKADFGEAVTKAELKELLATIEKDIDKGVYDEYGTKFGEIFTKAFEAAKLAIEDGNDDDITAAYQVLKSVLAKKQDVTNAALKELVSELSSKYNKGNIINDELEDDYYYEPDTWTAFANAYEEAEIACDSDNKTEVCDAYFTLYDADAALKATTQVTKTELNAAYKAYREVIEQKNKYEDWRRGTATESVNSGSTDTVKPDFKNTLVTFGDLFGIISGDSTATTLGGKSVAGTWVKFAAVEATLEASIDTTFEKFMGLKTATKTANAEIVNAYNACQDAVRVYNGWKVDDVRRGSKASFEALIRTNATTLWTLDLDKDGTADALAGMQDAAFFGAIPTGATWSIEDGKIYLNNATASDIVVKLDENSKMAYDADGKFENGTASNAKTVAVPKNGKLDVTKYMPEFNLKTAGTAYLSYLDGKCKADGNFGVTLTDALQAKENIAAVEAAKVDVDYSVNFDTNVNGTTADVALSKEYNNIMAVTAKSNSAAAYSLAYRILEYALKDIIPAPDASYKKSDVKAYVAKANDLLKDAENSATFAAESADLATALAATAEWLAAASKKDYVEYEAVNYTAVKTMGDIDGGATSTMVWKEIDKEYTALSKKLANFPYSYEEIVGTIADVAEGLDAKAYGNSADAVKAALEKVAYDLVTLKTKTATANNPYDEDTYAFIKYNRVHKSETDSQKALVADYKALLKTVEDAGKSDVTKGDIDGDGVVSALDALAALKAASEAITLTDAQKAAADVDGDGYVTALDALAILKAASQG